MRTLIVHGSPHRNGNSSTLAQHFASGLRDADPSGHIAEFRLNEMDIRPCQGCHKCLATAEPACVQPDDMHKIYGEWIGADNIVLATPVFWWHVNGMTKTFVDRWHALLLRGDQVPNFTGKNFVLAISFLHPQNGDPVIDMFADIAKFGHMDFHVLRHHAKTGRAEDNPELLTAARALGRSLGQQ